MFNNNVSKYIKIGLVSILGMALATQAFALTISGSTTVQKRILEPCQASIEKDLGLSLTILGVGTGAGFKQLLEGKVAVAAASAELSELLKKNNLPENGTYKEHVLFKDDIVAFVNEGNGVSSLTWDQLKDIYTGKVTNWKDVGGADLPIMVISSQKGTGTQAAFEEIVLKKADTVATARFVRSDREQMPMVSKLKGAIGYGSKTIVTASKDKVKIIKSKEIVRPLSLITKGEPDAETKKLIDYLMTPKAKKMFN